MLRLFEDVKILKREKKMSVVNWGVMTRVSLVLSDLEKQIFQNALVTSNKMVQKERHNFLTQFSIPFQMVCSVLLQVIGSKTIE